MRARSTVLVSLLFAVVFAGCAKTNQNAGQATPGSSPTAAASSAGVTPAASPSPVGSAAATGSPSATGSALPTETAPPTPQPTPATPPPGLPPGWEKQYERVENGREAQLLVRTGAIDNLGYGWPQHFTPFSGKSTPAHEWPCHLRSYSAPGTDRIMLGTSVPIGKDGAALHPLEGYSGCMKRPDNLPQAIAVNVGALPPKIHDVFIQAFVDDFQPVPLHSHFQVTLNGTRLPNFEDAINQLDQTGPIGKLLTIELLPEYWPLLKSGAANLLFDDPTTGKADGYAINFVRILVNHKPWRYAVNISCNVVDAANQKPIAKADVAAADVKAVTGANGNCTLRDVPAGLVSVTAGAVGYDAATQLLDLPAGQHGQANFQLKKHKESVADLRRQIEQSGTVAIYGIRFDTASAKLRPDSLSSLNEVLGLIDGIPNSRWIIAGHTDNQGGAEYNMALSLARARSVVTWLQQHGIAGNRLTAQGYGFTRPVADNSTDAGRALNRRVEVSVVK
ncbi:MAG TPA: OmpA family protein [Candidatus Baltobacteraceae bacterium]|nr:OmpA family protein [Candidatus Baltobacteraceae bacterium]